MFRIFLSLSHLAVEAAQSPCSSFHVSFLHLTTAIIKQFSHSLPVSFICVKKKEMNNPHEAIRPNFNADRHEQERLALVENGLTTEQAIQTLERLWNLNNDREKEAWDQRLAEAAQADAQAAREVEEDAAHRRREEEEDADLARHEDKKKHKSKYTSIPDVMVPSSFHPPML